MSDGVYIEHRYGLHNGRIKVQGRGGSGGTSYRNTASAMLDKCRYNETRLSGESNTIYDESGDDCGGYRAAYSYTSAAADRLAEENISGRSRGKSYIYDTTLNPGSGRLSDAAAHRMAHAFREELRAAGYKIEGFQYAIHQGTQHTHIHAMYATNKTIQLKNLRSTSVRMRQVARELERERDLTRNQQLTHTHAHAHDLDRERTR